MVYRAFRCFCMCVMKNNVSDRMAKSLLSYKKARTVFRNSEMLYGLRSLYLNRCSGLFEHKLHLNPGYFNFIIMFEFLCTGANFHIIDSGAVAVVSTIDMN